MVMHPPRLIPMKVHCKNPKCNKWFVRYSRRTKLCPACWEKIFKNDIEYISKESIIEMIGEMIKKYEPEGFSDYSEGEEALIELKQKIEAL